LRSASVATARGRRRQLARVRERGRLDEPRVHGQPLARPRAGAGGHRCVRADRDDHAVVDDDGRVVEHASRLDDHRGTDDGVRAEVRGPHAVDGRLLADGERGRQQGGGGNRGMASVHWWAPWSGRGRF
jgi:hypothetical protein